MNKLRGQQFDEKLKPFAEEIRRLYLEKYLSPIAIEKALDKKVTTWQIRRFLMKAGFWQGRGTVHFQLRREKARLNRLDINDILFREDTRCKKIEERAWAKASWSDHPEYVKWRNRKRYNERYYKHVDFSHKLREEERTGPGYQIIRNLRYGIQKTGVVRLPPQASVVGCSPKRLEAHIESQFTEGMTWKNYGTFWDVGTIKPLIAFDKQNLKQISQHLH
ncbi:MAG: hypothetical protein O7C75_04145, partial [Verrucomicrobia bacterium]|nr:hypothetical protein [Verrucomicrobiota bacterium]